MSGPIRTIDWLRGSWIQYLFVSGLVCGLGLGELLLESRAFLCETLEQTVLLLELLAGLGKHPHGTCLGAASPNRLEPRLSRR